MPQLFQGFTAETFTFFLMIRLNNNMQFFEENRAVYEQNVKTPLYALACDMEELLHEVDPAIETRPQRAVARLRRTSRYTRDKSLFRDHLWIGWRDRPRQDEMGTVFGFYFEIGFDEMNCGGGYYAADPKEMTRFRRRILLQPERFEAIISAPGMRRFALGGEDYKRIAVPDTLSEAAAQYYRKKSFFLEQNLPINAENTSAKLVDTLKDAVRALAPLYEFINEQDAAV